MYVCMYLYSNRWNKYKCNGNNIKYLNEQSCFQEFTFLNIFIVRVIVDFWKSFNNIFWQK